MRRILTFSIALLYTLLLTRAISVPTTSVQANFSDEDVIPKDLDFTQLDVCSGHECFYQVSVDKNEQFIVLSRYTDISENRNLVYRVCYIDVYNSAGSFLAELSFYTEQDVVAELKDNSVIIYFYDRILVYDLNTQQLHGSFTEAGASVENGTFERLQKTTFVVGKWEYKCKRAFHGYTELMRTDGNESEILVSLSGDNFSIWNTLIPAVIISIGGLSLWRILRKRKGRV